MRAVEGQKQCSSKHDSTPVWQQQHHNIRFDNLVTEGLQHIKMHLLRSSLEKQ